MKKRPNDKTHRLIRENLKIDEYSMSYEQFVEKFNEFSVVPENAEELNVYWEISSDAGYYDSRDYYIEFNKTYWIAYTDEELEQRRKAAREASRKAAETRKANEIKRATELRNKELAELERLKKKYESVSK